MFELLSAAVDLAHALAMLVWGAGLPLLFWHRWPQLSRAYMLYSLSFVGISVLSQLTLGECFLTTLARELATQGTSATLRNHTSFTVQLVEAVAGIRPSERTAVRLWELAIFVTSVSMLLYVTRRHQDKPPTKPRPGPRHRGVPAERLS
jgi:hypothetical protein